MSHKIQPPGITTTSRQSSPLDRWAKGILLGQLGKLKAGAITIEAEGTHVLGDSPPSGPPPTTIHVKHPACYRQILFRGTTGAAEAYILGHWDTDDLQGVLETFLANEHVYSRLDSGWAWVSDRIAAVMHRLNKNTPYGSLKNIIAHYDLGNDFFSTFLDETMAYSAGVFEHETSTLRDASEAKFDRICRKIHLSASDHLVEIGTGWGGFAIHAASTYGCKVTTTTISREQFSYASQRVEQMGLSDRITVIDKDYRDLTGSYNKLVSIEMIEAVGHEYLDTYLQKCASLLTPDGMMALQAITVPDAHYERHKRVGSFINQYIFPGSNLLSVRSICDSVAAGTQMHLANTEDITLHYARTLRLWRERFMDNYEAIKAQGKSEAFMRMWLFYLVFCEAGFRSRHIGNVQLVFANPECPHEILPLR